MTYFSGQPYVSQESIAPGEYDGCTFTKGNYKELNLGGYRFVDCIFDQCDLSLAKITGASFNDVTFRNCKQLGLRFDECEKMLLSFSFEGCVLNFSSFYGLKLKGTQFKNCQLQETEFANADLTGARFPGCDLTLAVFDNTILDGADFRHADNFIIDPEKNYLRKARFSQHGLMGLLIKYGIVAEP